MDNITICLVGDLKYSRTVHSFVRLLCRYKAKLIYISPRMLYEKTYVYDVWIYLLSDSLRMPQSLRNTDIYNFTECESLEEVLPLVDVLYITRIQRERFFLLLYVTLYKIHRRNKIRWRQWFCENHATINGNGKTFGIYDNVDRYIIKIFTDDRDASISARRWN